MAGRIYDTVQWRRLRLLKLKAVPLCEECERVGKLRDATVVDHRRPVRFGGAPFPPLEGLKSLCAPCHNAKTARGVEAGAVRTGKPRKGCDAQGRPLDQAHPWNGQADSPQIGKKSLRADAQTPRPATNIELVQFLGGGEQTDG